MGRGRRGNGRRVSRAVRSRINYKPHSSSPLPNPFGLVEDRRRFDPNRFYTPKNVWGKPNRIYSNPLARLYRNFRATKVAVRKLRKPIKVDWHLRERIGFVNPMFTMVCIRRKIRREVLHALGLKNKGRGGSPRKRNQFTKVRC